MKAMSIVGARPQFIKLAPLSRELRRYANLEFLKNLARVRGAQAGVRYAEAFETIRWVI